MGRLLDDLERKLKAIENNLAEEVAKDTNKLFEDSVRYALVDWYNGYDPTVYKRTNNFMNVLKTARTSGKGNLLTFSVSSGDMRTYKGFDIPPYKGYQKQSLQPSTAFDFMWNAGEHGHGYWQKAQSLPTPDMYVDRDVSTGFDGRLDDIVNKKIDEILRK